MPRPCAIWRGRVPYGAVVLLTLAPRRGRVDAAIASFLAWLRSFADAAGQALGNAYVVARDAIIAGAHIAAVYAQAAAAATMLFVQTAEPLTLALCGGGLLVLLMLCCCCCHSR
eukprot:1172182-Prymnesium_polylepis.1